MKKKREPMQASRFDGGGVSHFGGPAREGHRHEWRKTGYTVRY